MTLRALLTLAQAGTFVGLAGVLFIAGEWRLALAQVLLAVVTGLVYL